MTNKLNLYSGMTIEPYGEQGPNKSNLVNIIKNHIGESSEPKDFYLIPVGENAYLKVEVEIVNIEIVKHYKIEYLIFDKSTIAEDMKVVGELLGDNFK